MTITYTAKAVTLNGKTVSPPQSKRAARSEKEQFAIMLKAKLGL